MKKGFFKLMTAVVTMAALASCSDDLGLGNDAQKLGKADLTATIMDLDNSKFTRLGMMETLDGMNPWKDGKDAGWGWAFTEGDQIRVFSMEAMTYEVYNLVDGANAATATFAKEKSVQTLPEGQKWAITDAQFVYSLSPTDEGKPRLTYTIPYVYKAQVQTGESVTKEVDGEETEVDANIIKFAAPFWAKASEGEENAEGNVTLDASLAPMTAFLRIDMAQLPNDAKYIVLTTHGSVTENEDGDRMYDGFQLVEPDPNGTYDLNGNTKVSKVKNNAGELVNYNGRTKLSWWEGDDVPAAITDGNSEQLSGTFNAILEVIGEGKDAVYPALGVDKGLENGDDFYTQYGISRLVTRDEMRIDVRDLQARGNGVFWIPVIAQHYNHLYVLAVTELSNYAYKYVGNMLADFTDLTLEVGDKQPLNMNMDNIGEVCPWHLNEAIDNINKLNRQGIACDNILNVDVLTTCTEENHYFGRYASGVYWHADGIQTGKTLAEAMANHAYFINYSEKYPHDKIWVQGEGNLVLNIDSVYTEEASDKAQGNAYRSGQLRTEQRSEFLLVSDSYGNELNQNYREVATEQIENNVTLNVPSTLEGMMCDLPTYNVTIAANENYTPAEAKDLVVDVHGAPTNFVTGHNVQEVSVDENGKASYGLKDFKSAAIRVVNGIKTLNVLEYTKGDVYVYPGMKENVEINTALNVWTTQGIDVRIDDALVYDLNYMFSSNQNPNYVYTTGSAAMHHVGVVDDPDYALVPNDVTLTSYWTGAALNYPQLYDIDDGFEKYDNGTIYTVAQLASMGENEQAKYIIDDLVLDMWLGGSKYGWVGPNVLVDGFEFDGNGKALKNMTMPGPKSETTANYNKRNIYVYDPHFCCTTCGWERQIAGTTAGEGRDSEQTFYLDAWGLIRSIGNEKPGDYGVDGPVLISNVYLNDVYADDKDGAEDGSGVDHIGSVVGKAAVNGDITFTNNIVGMVEIDVTGDYVGGMIGQLIDADKLTIEDSKVGSRSKKVAGDDYVGGIVGAAEVDQIVMNNNSVTVTDGIYGNAFVGGLAGQVIAGDAMIVPVGQQTPTQTTEEVATFVKQSVKAGKIQAYAQDLDPDEVDAPDAYYDVVGDQNDEFMPEGSIAGGFVGLLNASAARIDTATVDITDIIADSQFAGGLVAVSGCSTLNLYTADVKAETIKANEGYVGGELAYAPWGTVNVGYVPTKNIKPETNIEVGTLAGPWAVGGVVGNNNNNAKIYVLASPKNGVAKGETKYGYFINVNIGGYETTVDDVKTYFDANAADSKANYAGTFSNILGKLDGKLYINEALLTVTDNLDSATKKAVGYQERPDQYPTPGAEVELFWGDYNGYVGAGVSGNYYLTKLQADLEKSGSKVVGDQPDDETGFNLYKSEADYSATSKLVTE